MSRDWVAVEITDEDDIAETLHAEDGAEWGRFFRGLLYATAAGITFWVAVGALVWAVWPR